MTTWRFSDGTTAQLGGTIEGDTLFAQELRALLADPPVGVQLYPGPGGGAWLDVTDPALFDAWLVQEMERGFRREQRLKLTERPDNIPPLPPDARESESGDEFALY